MIDVTGVTKRYKSYLAVSDLSLNVPQGEIFGFLGPNGAGKTTTIRMLSGLLLPTAGEGVVGGVSLHDRQQLKRVIGLMPESQGYYGYMTPLEYLGFFGRLYEVPAAKLRTRIGSLLETVGLTYAARRPVGQFSRGMRQRLGLARTIIHEPRVVFLDEPSLGLDPQGQREMQQMIRQINTEWQVTVFLSSHLLGEVAQLCHRVAIMRQGEVLASGQPEALSRELGQGARAHIDVGDIAKAAVVCGEEGIAILERDGQRLTVALGADHEALPRLLARLVAAGVAIYGAVPQTATLEEVFLNVMQSPAERAVSA
ncbi:MAG: hypothetical protein JWN15_4089 [Firmicutes bacterium]|nr:hypothetical protein [Bacillota bacterium]